jgi:hypothetical protein
MQNKNSKSQLLKNNKSKSKTLRTTIPNQLFAASFPREMKVKLSYFELQSFTGSTGAGNDRVYNLNSIFDPYQTGVGHQPQGHDQWATFYNRYRVDRAHVIMTFTGSTSGSGVIVGILGNNDASVIIDPSVFAESPLSMVKHYSLGGPSVVLTKQYDLAQITGVMPSVYKSDDRYQALFSSNPSEQIVLHTYTCDLNTAAVPLSYTIHITYDVTMFDPVQLPLS